MKYTYCN